MKKKLKQIVYDMRHQPVIAWTTFIATATCIFLIIVMEITTHITVVPFAPESCRNRLMLGAYIHKEKNNGESDWTVRAGGLSYHAARTLYSNLDGVERTSFMEMATTKDYVRGTTKDIFPANCRRVDSEFFNIFDHKLIAGRFFTVDESESLSPSIVISESTARNAFGSTDCIGKEMSVGFNKYLIIGVVKDSSPLAMSAWGDVFIVTGLSDPAMTYSDEGKETQIFGNVSAALLLKDGVDYQAIRNQVKKRYAIIDTELAPDDYKTIYHGAPFTQEQIGNHKFGPDWTPEDGGHVINYILYMIALIVPAINLGSMLNSRMRRRLSELGLRRAFGCTRGRIFTDIISENFIVTLAGGIAGLILGMIVAQTYTDLYEDMLPFGEELHPAITAVINWDTILLAFCMCFVLNIFSACVPAWRASRIKPVYAINAK